MGEMRPVNEDDSIWVSPVDGHFHYTMHTRSLCAVCGVQDERDRAVKEARGAVKLIAEAHEERNRLRAALLDILVVESIDNAHLLANAALETVPSELDEVVAAIARRDELDRLRAVEAAARELQTELDERLELEADVALEQRDNLGAKLRAVVTPPVAGDGTT